MDEFVRKERWTDGYSTGKNECNAIIHDAIKQLLVSHLKRDEAPLSADAHLAKALSLLLSICDNGYLDNELTATLNALMNLVPE